MSHRSLDDPAGIEHVTEEEAHHAQVEELLCLVSREQEEQVSQCMKAQCSDDVFLIIQTPELLWKNTEIDNTQQRHQEGFCCGIER